MNVCMCVCVIEPIRVRKNNMRVNINTRVNFHITHTRMYECSYHTYTHASILI